MTGVYTKETDQIFKFKLIYKKNKGTFEVVRKMEYGLDQVWKDNGQVTVSVNSKFGNSCIITFRDRNHFSLDLNSRLKRYLNTFCVL